MGLDSATFWGKGTEVPSLSRDKGTTGQAPTLATGRAGTAKFGTGRAGTPKTQDVLKQENDVLKQKMLF